MLGGGGGGSSIEGGDGGSCPHPLPLVLDRTLIVESPNLMHLEIRTPMLVLHVCCCPNASPQSYRVLGKLDYRALINESPGPAIEPL